MLAVDRARELGGLVDEVNKGPLGEVDPLREQEATDPVEGDEQDELHHDEPGQEPAREHRLVTPHRGVSAAVGASHSAHTS